MLINTLKGRLQTTLENKSHANVFTVWSNAAINDIGVCIIGHIDSGVWRGPAEE